MNSAFTQVGGWRILYHQGTIISTEEDDTELTKLPLSASHKLKGDQHGILIVKTAGPVINSEMVREESQDDLG
jgi:hypothetical protein